MLSVWNYPQDIRCVMGATTNVQFLKVCWTGFLNLDQLPLQPQDLAQDDIDSNI